MMTDSYRRLWELFADAWRPDGTLSLPTRLHRRLRVGLFLGALAALMTIHWAALLLDEVIFPQYRALAVAHPLFVVGVPRSGTTFLHRVLALDAERFTTPCLWELLFAPAIVEHRLITAIARLDDRLGGPAGRLVRRVESALLTPLDAVHPMRLAAPDEDYLALVPLVRCFALVMAFPASETIWQMAAVDRAMPAAERRRLMAFYRGIVQRHLFVRGPHKRLLSKNPSFTPMIRTLAEAFPDARFIGCLRDPLEAIPSHLSAVCEGTRSFGIDIQGTPLQRRFSEMMIDYYRHLTTCLPPLGPGRAAIVRLNELHAALGSTVERVYAQFGLTIGPAFARALAEQQRRSRGYRSSHRYTLEQFGLDRESLAARLTDVLDGDDACA